MIDLEFPLFSFENPMKFDRKSFQGIIFENLSSNLVYLGITEDNESNLLKILNFHSSFSLIIYKI